MRFMSTTASTMREAVRPMVENRFSGLRLQAESQAFNRSTVSFSPRA